MRKVHSHRFQSPLTVTPGSQYEPYTHHLPQILARIYRTYTKAYGWRLDPFRPHVSGFTEMLDALRWIDSIEDDFSLTKVFIFNCMADTIWASDELSTLAMLVAARIQTFKEDVRSAAIRSLDPTRKEVSQEVFDEVVAHMLARTQKIPDPEVRL